MASTAKGHERSNNEIRFEKHYNETRWGAQLPVEHAMQLVFSWLRQIGLGGDRLCEGGGGVDSNLLGGGLQLRFRHVRELGGAGGGGDFRFGGAGEFGGVDGGTSSSHRELGLDKGTDRTSFFDKLVGVGSSLLVGQLVVFVSLFLGQGGVLGDSGVDFLLVGQVDGRHGEGENDGRDDNGEEREPRGDLVQDVGSTGSLQGGNGVN